MNITYLEKNLNRMTVALQTGFSDPNFAEANSYFQEVERFLSLKERVQLAEAWRDVYTDGVEAVAGVVAVIEQIVADRNDFRNSLS